MHEDSYGAVTARYYDAAYGTVESHGADAAFYRALAGETGGPVLEIGCGTGRVLAEVAADGHACTGLDLSDAMLEVLRARLPAVASVAGDMRDFELGTRFALVYSAFRAFQHLETVDDQLACLGAVRRHLAPGGTFAFDVFNPRYENLLGDADDEVEDLRFEHEGRRVIRYATIRRDRGRQILQVRFRYERWRGDAVEGNETSDFTLRWFFRYELEHLMHRAGFAEVAIFGDFDRSPVGRRTPAFLVVARAD